MTSETYYPRHAAPDILIRESCTICGGDGRLADAPCTRCLGTGRMVTHSYSRERQVGGPDEVDIAEQQLVNKLAVAREREASAVSMMMDVQSECIEQRMRADFLADALRAAVDEIRMLRVALAGMRLFEAAHG